jgi:hypothetical protein
MDRLAGRHKAIFVARDKKLETAREARRIKRQQITPLSLNQPAQKGHSPLNKNK